MVIGVLKFGGTSVRSIARIHHVAELIERSPFDRKVVVLSAMGDTTDYLMRLAHSCSDNPDRRELDMLLSTGEQVSIALLAIVLGKKGIRAKSFTGQQVGIFTDADHSDARIQHIDDGKLRKAVGENDVVIIAGFQGVSELGEITTLGRGGSDTTAVALAVALGASTCDIYTDVEGICTADPRIVSSTSVIPLIDYEEALEIAEAGAQVIHPRAVALAEQFDIQVRVRSTFKPDSTGTCIRRLGQMEKRERLLSISLSEKEARLRLSGIQDQDPLERISAVIAEVNLSVRSIREVFESSSAEGASEGVTYIDVAYEEPQQIQLAVECLQQSIPSASVSVDLNVARVSLIGRCFGKAPLLIARLLRSLRDCGINPHHVELTDSRLSCLIDRTAGALACNTLSSAFLVDRLEESGAIA